MNFRWEALELLATALSELATNTKGASDVRSRLFFQGGSECEALRRVAEDVTNNAKHLSTYQISRFAEAFALLGYRDENFFAVLSGEVRKKRDNLTGSQISRLCWAYTQLDIQDTQLTQTLVKAARSYDRHEYLSVGNRARIGWSLTHLSPKDVKAVLTPPFLEDDECSIDTWALMYQALLLSGQISRGDRFPRYREVHNQAMQLASSQLEEDVAHALTRYLKHVPHALERQQCVGGVFVDLLLYLESRTVAIECDGVRYHFSSGPDGGKRFGKDLVQQQVLEALNMEVVHITCQEWKDTPTRRLLSMKLGL